MPNDPNDPIAILLDRLGEIFGKFFNPIRKFSNRIQDLLSKFFFPLHYAVRNSDIDAVESLLANGTNVNSKNFDGDTPLNMAIMNAALKKDDPETGNKKCDRKIIDLLINHSKTNINFKNDLDQTPLHCASLLNDLKTMNLLISKKPDVNVQDIFGFTPLHHSSHNRCIEAMEILITNGANPNVRAKDVAFNKTPLHSASKKGAYLNNAMKTLIAKGADPYAKDKRGINAFDRARDNGITDAEIETFIKTAEKLQSFESTSQPEDFVQTDQSPETDMDHAYIYSNKILHLIFKPIRYILDIPNQIYNLLFNELHYAAAYGDIDKLKYWIERRANLNAKNFFGHTPLRLAVKEGRTDAVKLLLESGAKVDDANKDGHTALHFASMFGKDDSLKLLLKYGAKADAVDRDGNTPLHYASEQGSYGAYHANTAKLLLEAGAEVDIKNRKGCTPLHLAAEDALNPTNTAKLLLEAGAKVDAVNRDGNTPLHLAVQRSPIDSDLINLFTDNGANILVKNNKKHTPLYYLRREKIRRDVKNQNLKDEEQSNTTSANTITNIIAAMEGSSVPESQTEQPDQNEPTSSIVVSYIKKVETTEQKSQRSSNP